MPADKLKHVLHKAKVKTESIGTQTVSGLSVTRTQKTTTCPNGFVHDSKPNPMIPE